MKIQLLAISMMVCGCCAMEESFDSGDLQRLFSEEIAVCAVDLQDRLGGKIDARFEQSYEQSVLCRACLGLCMTNGLYTMGRLTPSEQYPAIKPIFGENEPSPYVEHGLTCFAAMCTIWTMPSGSADHSCICGNCKKIVQKLVHRKSQTRGVRNVFVPRPVFMAIAEKKDN